MEGLGYLHTAMKIPASTLARTDPSLLVRSDPGWALRGSEERIGDEVAQGCAGGVVGVGGATSGVELELRVGGPERGAFDADGVAAVA